MHVFSCDSLEHASVVLIPLALLILGVGFTAFRIVLPAEENDRAVTHARRAGQEAALQLGT